MQKKKFINGSSGKLQGEKVFAIRRHEGKEEVEGAYNESFSFTISEII